ncbi:putative cytochrome P450 [Microthyrium microscopicum]|uniref:Putative cytochrome P450 n=1 Tax=Microthyrium microscopicum TaxID=703497 RepID=A0A6A6UJE7_9PEZI|nr:putative cytochrome P450 [Microthyrium microscopicum]
MGSIDHANFEKFENFDIDESAAVNLNDPAQIYAEYDYLRSKCPVIHTTKYNGYWLLTRHADIKAAAGDSATYISSVKAVVPSDPRGIRRPPLNYDAPNHTPYRTALDRTLHPRRLARLASILETHAQQELAPLLEKGEGDMCTHFGALYSAWVETSWLNLDEDMAPKLATTAAAWVNAWRNQDADEVKRHSDVLYDIARGVLRERRERPRDPLEDPASSLLLEKGPDGEFLKEEHLVGGIRQCLVVAMIAPSILMGGICKHLSEDKDLQNKLRSEPELIPAAIEEFIRLYSPYRGFSRTTSKDVDLHGETISPGNPITMTYAAANRDPEVFPEPAKFILNRPNITAHLGFGRGRHRCVGMPLARLAMQIALKVLLQSTSDFEINGELEYARMPEIGIISCPVKFS